MYLVLSETIQEFNLETRFFLMAYFQDAIASLRRCCFSTWHEEVAGDNWDEGLQVLFRQIAPPFVLLPKCDNLLNLFENILFSLIGQQLSPSWRCITLGRIWICKSERNVCQNRILFVLLWTAFCEQPSVNSLMWTALLWTALLYEVCTKLFHPKFKLNTLSMAQSTMLFAFPTQEAFREFALWIHQEFGQNYMTDDIPSVLVHQFLTNAPCQFCSALLWSVTQNNFSFG